MITLACPDMNMLWLGLAVVGVIVVGSVFGMVMAIVAFVKG